MSVTVGDKLGAYQILARLGAGGMGDVYRAWDTKLDRDVAIKVLPAAFARDPESLARFEREAKLVASLNHPNIAQIYGVEVGSVEVGSLQESGETLAIVMELVPGGTLHGPLPLEEALPIASQIADAVAAAHEKGILHRDLKPANIMVTPNGLVKVLDFGLASSASPPPGGVDPENSATLTLRSGEPVFVLLAVVSFAFAYRNSSRNVGPPHDGPPIYFFAARAGDPELARHLARRPHHCLRSATTER